MADLIQRDSVAEAWIAAVELLLDRGGKSFHLTTAFPASYEAESAPWQEVDDFLVQHKKCKWELQTVVNTIFPEELYHPDLGDAAAERLYETYAMSMRVHRRSGHGHGKETYFNRLVAYPVATGSTERLGEKAEKLNEDGTWNQIAFFLDRLTRQRVKGKRRNSYELGLSHPVDADLRVQSPLHDISPGSFPCLSHISLTLVDDRVNLTATYRNQYLITRGFGNYIGLIRLAEFIARESGAEPGEVQVVATGADVELESFSAGEIKELVTSCRAALDSQREGDVAHA